MGKVMDAIHLVFDILLIIGAVVSFIKGKGDPDDMFIGGGLVAILLYERYISHKNRK